MSSLISLQCQLLCACGCSYNINNSTGVYTSPAGDPFGPAIGWTTGVPTAIVGGDVNENAALVGTVNLTINNVPTESIVIAFQGTIPPAYTSTSIVDWLTDFLAEPTSATSTTENVPGLVHSGILQDTLDIMADVNAAVASLQNASNTLPVYITGHSKGGGQASIMAALLYGSIPASYIPAAVYTFASPMIGDQDFVNAFPATIPVSRFENYLDIVPFLAPSGSFIDILKSQAGISTLFLDTLIALFDAAWLAGESVYVPLGTLNYIDENYAVSNPGSNPCASDIASVLAEGIDDVGQITGAHSHLCGAGYMSGTCSNSGVCPVGS